MTSAEFDEAQVKNAVDMMAADIALKGFKLAVTAGGKIIENAYRDILAELVADPGGPNFMKAWKAVGTKVAQYQSGLGYYAVIGTKRSGGQRLAPQVLFGERGTRQRKTASGANRGIMPVQFWLARAREKAYDSAREVMFKRLAAYAAKYRK